MYISDVTLEFVIWEWYAIIENGKNIKFNFSGSTAFLRWDIFCHFNGNIKFRFLICYFFKRMPEICETSIENVKQIQNVNGAAFYAAKRLIYLKNHFLP